MKGLRVGDIVNVKGNTWLDKMVRYFTSSVYTHSGLVYSVEKDYVVVAEMVSDGFRLKHYSRDYVWYDCGVYRHVDKRDGVSESDVKYMRDWIYEHRHSSYGFLTYFFLVLYYFFGWRSEWMSNQRLRSLICSEYVALAYLDVWGLRVSDYPSYMVTPGELSEGIFLFKVN